MNNIEENLAREDRYASYGVRHSNPLWTTGISHDDVDHSTTISLSDKRLVKIVRLRLLSDLGLGWWDVSYCYGQMKGSERLVRVDLDEYQINKAGRGSVDRRHLVEIAQRAGVYAKKVGLLNRDGSVGDAISTLQ